MTHSVLIIAVTAAVTAGLRFLPFLVFSAGEEPPKIVTSLSRLLPAAVMGMLVIYCLKNVSFLAGSHGLPEVIAVAAVAASYVWKRNTLLSILLGTILYMVLVQAVFV